MRHDDFALRQANGEPAQLKDYLRGALMCAREIWMTIAKSEYVASREYMVVKLHEDWRCKSSQHLARVALGARGFPVKLGYYATKEEALEAASAHAPAAVICPHARRDWRSLVIPHSLEGPVIARGCKAEVLLPGDQLDQVG